MSVDRLQELRRKKGKVAATTVDGDVELQIVDNTKDEKQIATGDSDVDLQLELYKPINLLIAEIDEATEKLDALRGKDNKTTTDQGRKKIMAEMNEINSSTMSKANSIKDALMQIKSMNDKFDKEEGNANSARAQVRNNLYMTTCKNFQQKMSDFTDAREAFRENITSRMVRQVKIIDPTKGEDEARSLIENGQAEQMISKALASDNLKEVVAELRARNQELLALQRNVEQLYEMFRDLYNLIEMNGESINIIEQRVAKSLDYVQKAEVEIAKAKEHQKKAGKLKCILLLVLLVVAILVMAPILITAS